MSERSHSRVAGAAVALGISAAGVAAACSDSSSAGSTERFCEAIADNQETLLSPPLDDADDIDELVELYRGVGNHAPLAIEDDWDALTELYETAASLEPGDPEAREAVTALAFATERSAVETRNWVSDNCDLDLGPVATIVDHDPQLPPPGTDAEG